MNLSSNFGGMATIPSIQLLGLEMLLHFLLGPEVLSFAKQNKLVLSLGTCFKNSFNFKTIKIQCIGVRRENILPQPVYSIIMYIISINLFSQKHVT